MLDRYGLNNEVNIKPGAQVATKSFRFTGIGLKLVIYMYGAHARMATRGKMQQKGGIQAAAESNPKAPVARNSFYRRDQSLRKGEPGSGLNALCHSGSTAHTAGTPTHPEANG